MKPEIDPPTVIVTPTEWIVEDADGRYIGAVVLRGTRYEAYGHVVVLSDHDHDTLDQAVAHIVSRPR